MIVAGGGTGGHLFPGLAVAEALNEEDAAMFIGSSTGIEARVIPRTGFAFSAIEIRGVRGRGFRGVLDFLIQVPLAVQQAGRDIAAFGADVVLGVGGYASFPAVSAAWLRGVPTVLLEQNAHPGMANRCLGRVASRVCTTFAAAEGYFPPSRVVVTGNPVRNFAVSARSVEERTKAGAGACVLVFGGSQGARSLNQALGGAAEGLNASLPGLRIIHQTGRGAADSVRAAYAAAGIDAEVHEFIEDMGAAYAAADLVVCRAGATTLAELALVGRAAILVPYPRAADDHQRSNAEQFVQAGAAKMILDADLDPGGLAAEVESILGDPRQLGMMEEAARGLAEPEAAARVAGLCRSLVEARGADE